MYPNFLAHHDSPLTVGALILEQICRTQLVILQTKLPNRSSCFQFHWFGVMDETSYLEKRDYYYLIILYYLEQLMNGENNGQHQRVKEF